MGRIINTEDRVSDVARAIAHLILTGGVSSITMRAVGTHCRISVSALMNHLDSKERILRVCGRLWMRAWMDQWSRPPWAARPSPDSTRLRDLLPTTSEEHDAVRVMLGWRELANHDVGLRQCFREVGADLRLRVADDLGIDPWSDDAALAAAAIWGVLLVGEASLNDNQHRADDHLDPQNVDALERFRLDSEPIIGALSRLISPQASTARSRSAETMASGSSAE